MPTCKIILGFVGPIASGKGTACQYLKEKYQAETFRFSTILRDILDRLNLEQSRDNMQNLSTSLRSIFGEDLLSKVILYDLKKSEAKIVILDGVRRQSDIQYIKNDPDFHLVEINAEPKIRHERIIKRSENTDDRQKTFEQFLADEQQETESQIKDVAQSAEFSIDNSKTTENLHQELDNIIKQLKS
ncbi:MAG: AAA family ATPase [Candidatus Parcubacteria bacterium]|nr:AAA family ATPase [Candidatus Parcubacteria bacterium]